MSDRTARADGDVGRIADRQCEHQCGAGRRVARVEGSRSHGSRPVPRRRRDADERASVELTAKIAPLRAAAKAARDKADKATPADKEPLRARAEELEADVTVTEAEATEKKTSAADNRRVARELRARAVKMVKETPAERQEASSCDPPFRFTPDGRKIYRLECLK